MIAVLAAIEDYSPFFFLVAFIALVAYITEGTFWESETTKRERRERQRQADWAQQICDLQDELEHERKDRQDATRRTDPPTPRPTPTARPTALPAPRPTPRPAPARSTPTPRPTPTARPTAPTPPPAEPTAKAQFASAFLKLKALHDEGVLTDEEFATKRQELADRLLGPRVCQIVGVTDLAGHCCWGS